MNQQSFAQLTGSLFYGGEKIVFTPGLTQLADGLQVHLEYRQITASAHHLLLRLRNTGTENTKQITQPKTLDLHIPADKPIHYHSVGGDDWLDKGFPPMDQRIGEPLHVETAYGRSSDMTAFPFFDITADDCTAVMAIGWTGQWCCDILPGDAGFSVQIGICDADFYLLPAEEIRLPSVLIVTGGSSRKARQEFRRVMRTHFSPTDRLLPGQKMPFAIQCYDRYVSGSEGSTLDVPWASEEGQLRTLQIIQKIPAIDTHWLDAAWFAEGFPNGVGNYRFHDGFPRGLKAISDEAHKTGKRFVLWFEPERVYRGSDMFPQTDKLLMDPEAPDNRLYHLGDPAAWSWLKETLTNMIRDNGVDVYRQDCNIWPLPYWRQHDEPGRKGIHEIKHIMGLYDLWDALLKEFPHLLIDSCASGGRRLDLEALSRTVSLWRSDTGCSPESEECRVTTWSQNHILCLSEYLPFHTGGIWNTDAYSIRSTATQGVACIFAVFDPDFDFPRVAAVMEEANQLRGYWNGDFYPLTAPTNDETVWCAYQLDRGADGVAYVFRREFAEQDTWNLKLEAVDAAAEYSLTLSDDQLKQTVLTCSGEALQKGLDVTIGRKRGSLVIRYQKM